MVHCCVPFCRNSKGKTSGISYHEFPSDEELRTKWLKVIGRAQFVPNCNSNSSVVCSEHFTPNDFKTYTKIRVLHRGSVPSIFPSYRPRKVAPRVTRRRRILKKVTPTANKRQKQHSSGRSQDCDQAACSDDFINNADFTVTEIKEELDAACCWMDSDTPQFTDFSPIIKKEIFANGFVNHEDQMNVDKVILKPGCANTGTEHQVICDIKDEEQEEKWSPYFPHEEVTVDEFNLDAVKVEPETDDKLASSFDEIHPSLLKEEQERSPCHSPEKQHELLFLNGPSDIYGHGIYTTHSDSEKRPKIVGGIERRKSVHNSDFDGQSFICPHCCHSFQSEVLLSQHTQIHTAVELRTTGPKEAAPDCRMQTTRHKYLVQDLVIQGEEPISSKDKELELLQKKYERLVAKNEKLNKELSKQCEEIKSYESKLKHLGSRAFVAKSRKRKNIVL